MELTPITRKENFLAKAAGDPNALDLDPITREEWFISQIQGGGGGGGAVSSVNGQTGAVVLTAADLDDSFKDALLDCFANVAWANEDGQQYYDALEAALYPIDHITAVYTQSGTVYDTDSLDSLKTDLVVTAVYDGGNTATVDAADYTLSGTLTAGTSTITVSYGGKTATFDVVVTEYNPYLYKLPSEFVSTGENSIDTGVSLASGKTYSVIGDFTCGSTDSTVRFVFANKIAGNSTYSGLQTKGTSSISLWGVGITYNGARSLSIGDRYRFVAVADVDNAKWTITMKNVSSGTPNTYTNSYTVPAFTTGKNVYVGNGEGGSTNTGFIGTMHDFKITDFALTSEEITAYLNGE